VTNPSALLLIGFVAAALLIWPGALLRYSRRDHWIAGYNAASQAEREKYDIEGLSHHLGNGLVTLGVLVFAASIALALESMRWLAGLLTAFLLVAFIIVVGGQKFTPAARFPASGESAHATHRVLRWLVSEKMYRALEAATHEWEYECACGQTEDYWEAGGIRKAVGQRRELRKCERCGKTSLQKVRRKRR